MVAELLKDRRKYFPRKSQALVSFLNNKLRFFSLPTKLKFTVQKTSDSFKLVLK